MKKILAIALSLVMLCSLSVAFAADTLTAAGNKSSDITLTYTAQTASTKVISVDIAWDDVAVAYNGGAQGTWTADHTYTGSTAASWTDDKATVTVTNHSNIAVSAKAEYTKTDEAITGTIAGEATRNLDAGVVNQKDNADKETFELTLSGTPTATTASQVVGSLKITIAEVA